MKQRAPDGKRRGGWDAVVQALVLLVLVAMGLVVMRSLGPGGSPTEAPPVPPPPATGPVSFTGLVLDSVGRPVAGAHVEAIIAARGDAEPICLKTGPTAADGAFSFPGVGRELVDVTATRGHLRIAVGPVRGGRCSLRLPATFRVYGRVMAAEDGRPLEGMEVRLGERVARTGGNGLFTFVAIPGDEVLPEIEVTGAGRKPLRRALPAEGGLDDLQLSVEGE